MEICRYPVRDAHLKPWIKRYWHLSMEDASIANKLLPTADIDLLINLGAPMVYRMGSRSIPAPPIHINGLRRNHSQIQQAGTVEVFGISFRAYGLFPFINQSLTAISDKVVDVFALLPELASGLWSCVSQGAVSEEWVLRIEEVLLGHMAVHPGMHREAEVIDEYMSLAELVPLTAFCGARGIHVRKFERMTKSYTAYSPTMLRRLHRFQVMCNEVVHRHDASLTEVSYQYQFFDQAHFIREFKLLAGESPSRFLRKKESIKENVKYR